MNPKKTFIKDLSIGQCFTVFGPEDSASEAYVKIDATTFYSITRRTVHGTHEFNMHWDVWLVNVDSKFTFIYE